MFLYTCIVTVYVYSCIAYLFSRQSSINLLPSFVPQDHMRWSFQTSLEQHRNQPSYACSLPNDSIMGPLIVKWTARSHQATYWWVTSSYLTESRRLCCRSNVLQKTSFWGCFVLGVTLSYKTYLADVGRMTSFSLSCHEF